MDSGDSKRKGVQSVRKKVLVRRMFGILLHLPSVYFAILGWVSIEAMRQGAIPLTQVISYFLFSCLFGCIGVALWRGKPPWR